MPIMKINPEVWRNESHQREIHRLLHEGREIEVMRRRNMGSVMDTSDGREDESEMKGVVSTMDLGGFKALEAREKRREQEEVMQEWSRAVNYTKEASRRRSWPNLVYPKPSVGLPVIQQQNGQPTNWIGQQGSIGTFPSMPTQFTQPRNLRRASFSGI
ncbi:hypothetical protein BGZ76_011508 [Entomortierella beljakovae]|nr:hypothetical protein BGZ76_011508 [Entomortierella beljakovae]